MSNVRIKCYKLRDDIFDKILYDFSSRITFAKTDNYLTGYDNKKDIYYDGRYLICPEYIINNYVPIENCTDWKQCRCKREMNMDEPLVSSLDGSRAWAKIMDILHKHYTDEEIEDCLHSHTALPTSQYHYNYPLDEVKGILKFTNCIYYDMNGAHNDALCEIFPKAKNEFEYLYKTRKEFPTNKDLANFFVGMLCVRGYRDTYNWINERTKNSLLEAMKITEGILLYANTDGYVISSPKADLRASTDLGKYKIVYQGDVYIYSDKEPYSPYWLIQMGDIMKGSCLTEVRKDIDLSKGNIIHYTKFREYLFTDNKGVKRYRNKAIDIIKENIWRKSEEK